MCPDRVVVSEVWADEWPELLRAMNASDGGFLVSIHADGPRDVLARLEHMAVSADPSHPAMSIRRQVAAAVDLITYQAKMQDGSRKLLQVTEVLGLRGDSIQLHDIFRLREAKPEEPADHGRFVGTGRMPNSEGPVHSLRTPAPMELLPSP
jgi:pilus assembly protein CpaF